MDMSVHERNIMTEIMKFMGELTFAQANPKIASQYSPRLFTIKVNRGYEDVIILALSFVRLVSGKKMSLCSLKTSGTIKSLMLYSRKVAS